MENFNKNWLVILLVAAIFGTLGYLVGKTSSQPHVMMWRGDDGKEFVIKSEHVGEHNTTIKIDTVLKDGKKVIEKEVTVKVD